MNETKPESDTSGRHYDEAMKLPHGKTCADCVHIRRCKAFGFTWPERTSCDFYPNKFRPASTGANE